MPGERDGSALALRDVHRLGDPEVGDHRAIRRQEDVAGLDVAVHDAGEMRRRQGARDVAQQVARLAQWQRAATRQPGAERLATHERHRVVGQPGCGLSRRENRHDVRRLESRRDADLAREPLRRNALCEIGMQDLHDDVAVQRAVAREEHARHSASAELAPKLVLRAERVGEQVTKRAAIGDGVAAQDDLQDRPFVRRNQPPSSASPRAPLPAPRSSVAPLPSRRRIRCSSESRGCRRPSRSAAPDPC